jgi:hypothetical protein
MTINFKNIVCLDLRTVNSSNIDRVSTMVNTHPDQILKFKEIEVVKIWIDLTSEYFVAYQPKGGEIVVKPAYCPVSKREIKKLITMTPISLKKVKTTNQKTLETVTTQKVSSNPKTVLEVDAILDKISASGMSSLSQEELEFLKSQ